MSKRPLLQLEIPRRSRTCTKGAEPLLPGMEYYSILFIEGETFKRQDFCPTCWEQIKAEKINQADSHWKSKVPAKQEALKDLSRDERAMELLREALQTNAPEQRAEAFVLALYLARKKQLILRHELEQDGELVSLYEDPSTEEILTVKQAELTPPQIKQIQEELAKKLKGK